jgi:mRNA interferase MazF
MVKTAIRRGDVWTASGGNNYAGKPRPVLIVQDDRFDASASVTICGFTTDPTEAPLFRLAVEPSPVNGLREPCRAMIDKVKTISKDKLGQQLGRLADADMLRVNRALLVFLGLAGPSDS